MGRTKLLSLAPLADVLPARQLKQGAGVGLADLGVPQQLVRVGGHDDVGGLNDTAEAVVGLLTVQHQLQEAAVQLVDSHHRPDALAQSLCQPRGQSLGCDIRSQTRQVWSTAFICRAALCSGCSSLALHQARPAGQQSCSLAMLSRASFDGHTPCARHAGIYHAR